jgi:outer membrane protein assembly factor BamA
MIRRQSILVFEVALLCAAVQAQQRPDRCKLHFTGDDPSEQTERLRVESLTLRGATNLDPSVQNAVVVDAESHDYDDRADMIDEIREKIREAWLELGYFEAQVEVTAEPVKPDNQELYRVVAEIHEGDQFRLDKIQMASAMGANAPLAIPPEELRRLIPLNDGDIFNVRKIRDGLENLRRAYGAQGYIDFTATPDFDIPHQKKSISIRMTLDEQAQYRVSDVSVLGVDPKLAQEMSAHLRRGALYDAPAFDKFFSDFVETHKRELPAEAGHQDLYVTRDVRARAVAIRADFRACSEIPK